MLLHFSRTRGPTDHLHSSPAPYFITFQVFLIWSVHISAPHTAVLQM
jgi:hypothetical protein